jgi:hypothetical protein
VSYSENNIKRKEDQIILIKWQINNHLGLKHTEFECNKGRKGQQFFFNVFTSLRFPPADVAEPKHRKENKDE